MADDRHYVPGDYYQLDDNSGFKVRASTTRKQWNNVVTQPAHFNPRQPQDLVVGVRDDQAVPTPRPRQTNRFTVAGTNVVLPSARGASLLYVASAYGFAVGDSMQVMLDSGVPFAFTLGAIGSATVDGVSAVTLSWSGTALPYSVGLLYGSPPDNAVLDLTSALVPPNETPSPSY